MPVKLRRSQPTDFSAKAISDILKAHAPSEVRKKALATGILFEFDPPRSGGLVDKRNMETWKIVMKEVLKLCPSGILNPSTILVALEQFDEFLGFAMTNAELEVVKKETFKGEHLWKQACIFKKFFAGLARVKSNSSTQTRHPSWLQDLLHLLEGPGDQGKESTKEDYPQSPSNKSSLSALQQYVKCCIAKSRIQIRKNVAIDLRLVFLWQSQVPRSSGICVEISRLSWNLCKIIEVFFRHINSVDLASPSESPLKSPSARLRTKTSLEAASPTAAPRPSTRCTLQYVSSDPDSPQNVFVMRTPTKKEGEVSRRQLTESPTMLYDEGPLNDAPADAVPLMDIDKPVAKYKFVFDVCSGTAKVFDAEMGGVVAQSDDHKETDSMMRFHFSTILMESGDFKPFWWKSGVTALEFVEPTTMKRPASAMAAEADEQEEDQGNEESEEEDETEGKEGGEGVGKKQVRKKPTGAGGAPKKARKTSPYGLEYSKVYHKKRAEFIANGVSAEVAKKKAAKLARIAGNAAKEQ